MQKNNLLKQIMAFEFCLVDLTQYLDTHRDDKHMISLFNEYKGVLDELKSKYEDMYGPLTPMTQTTTTGTGQMAHGHGKENADNVDISEKS